MEKGRLMSNADIRCANNKSFSCLELVEAAHPTLAATRKFLILAVVTFFFSAFSTLNAYAQDISVEIVRQQEMIGKLEDQFITSQRRILSSDIAYAGQESAYDQLNAVGNLLGSTNREFIALITSLTLANLVTVPHAIPQARKILDTQKQSMVKRMTIKSDFIEKSMLRVKDQETSRMLLEARDLFRSSVELVNRVQILEPRRK